MPDLTPLFGLLIIDREPFTFADLPGLAQAWLMDAGGFAFIGLILYILYALNAASDSTTKARIRVSPFMALCSAVALILYAVYGLLLMGKIGIDVETVTEAQKFDPTGYNKYVPPFFCIHETQPFAWGAVVTWLSGLVVRWQPFVLSLAGFFAILGIGGPFFAAMGQLVRRAASTGRAPAGTPGLAGTFALLVGMWAVIGAVIWFFPQFMPSGSGFFLLLGGTFALGLRLFFLSSSSLRRLGYLLIVLASLLFAASLMVMSVYGRTNSPGDLGTFLDRWVWAALYGQSLSQRELTGVVGCFAFLATAAWAAYRCRLTDRLGAVYAIAKLSVLDVVRSKVFLALLLLLLPALFPITWFLPFKAEDELRLTVGMTTWLTQVVLLLMAAALASFAIPNDVKNQNIYTVLTKPVQPFDVVLGRFFGFTALATVALAVMTFGSWLLIEASNISPQAREETFKARVPVRGSLRFASRQGDNIAATDVGREFNYRKYIAGHPVSSQRAIWSFGRPPSSLRSAKDAAVPVEFTFDIYRLTKGVENRGVDVNIRVTTWRCPQKPPPIDQKADGTWRWGDAAQEIRYLERAKDLLFAADVKAEKDEVERAKEEKREPVPKRKFKSRDAITYPKENLSGAQPGSPEWGVANDLAKEFGFYEVRNKEVFDYHPTSVLVPAGLFANAEATVDADGRPLPAPTDPFTGELITAPPADQQVMVYVKCETSSQMLGMAAGDLYLLEAEQSFGQNYFKAAVGLWCRLVLLIGLAVVCSTYLVGVVSFLAAGFVFVAGYFGQYITELALGKSAGGGPVAALSQLTQAKLPTAPVDATGGAKAAELADNVFAWLIRRVVNLFPDVYAYDWTPFLAEGFNVSFENLAMNLIVMAGYLLPWLILGFYLIRAREVAA